MPSASRCLFSLLSVVALIVCAVLTLCATVLIVTLTTLSGALLALPQTAR